MDLDELRAFLSIVEHGSLLEAARALGVSRTTLRRRAEALEARAGVPLFETTPSGVHVTEAGATLARHGRRLAEESTAVMSAVREVGQEPTGTLRVVLPTGLPPQVPIALLAMLRSRHPRLSVMVKTLSDPLAGRLDDVDLAVHFGARAARGPWVTKKLFPLRMWLVASRGYVDRKGTPASLEDLREHPMLAWQGPDSESNMLPLRDGGSFPIEPALVSCDIHMLRQAAIAGMGIAFVPDGLLPDPGFAEPPLVPILPEVVGEDGALWCAVPEVLKAAPKVRAALDSIALFASAFVGQQRAAGASAFTG